MLWDLPQLQLAKTVLLWAGLLLSCRIHDGVLWSSASATNLKACRMPILLPRISVSNLAAATLTTNHIAVPSLPSTLTAINSTKWTILWVTIWTRAIPNVQSTYICFEKNSLEFLPWPTPRLQPGLRYPGGFRVGCWDGCLPGLLDYHTPKPSTGK